MPSQSKIKDFCQLSHRESQECGKLKFEVAEPNRAVVHRKMPAIQARGCLPGHPGKLKFESMKGM